MKALGCKWSSMTVYESIWSYIIVNCSKWMYMKLHEDIYGIRIYMKAYGCISANMTVYESRWSYMNVNGSKLIYMKIYKALRWYILGYMLSKMSKLVGILRQLPFL